MKFVESNSPVDVIDVTSKNKFRWEWLATKDDHNDFLSDYIRKVGVDGVAWCCFCKSEIKYRSGGLRCFRDHSKTKLHTKNRSIEKSNQRLPAAMQALKSKIDGRATSQTLPYGAAPNLECLGIPNTSAPLSVPTDPRPVSLKDRVTHQEALLCSFMAEHTIPMTMAPHLIDLAKELSKDSKALAQLHMERQTATYKLRHGLSHLEHVRLVNIMKKTPFSINLDESTSKAAHKRVLNVLVSYYSEELKKCVCDLYFSVEMTVVNAETVFEAVRNKFMEDQIPLTNLVSVLSDSAAYMRGSISGFQARLKEVAPHIMDIDGDVCHHIHNSVKKFSTNLDPSEMLSKLLDDIYNDMDFSADLRDDLKSVCKHLGIAELMPLQRACHRWMSIYDASARFMEIHNALTLVYSSWLTVEEKRQNQPLLTKMLQGVKKDSRLSILSILQRLKSKKLTPAGRERKNRIADRLIKKRQHSLLVANILISTLPLFKSFILTFEQKKTLHSQSSVILI